MTAADESRVVWRHEPRTEAGQGAGIGSTHARTDQGCGERQPKNKS